MLAVFALVVALQDPAIDFAKTWTGVRGSIQGRYWARQLQHDRMEKLLDKYEPRAKAAKDKKEFETAVNSMIDEFGDSHFGFFTKSDQGFYVMQSLARGKDAEPFPNIGAWFKPAGDGYTIQMLLNGGEAEKAGMRKGDMLGTVDGKPFTPVDSLQGKEGQKVHVTFVRAGKPMAADLEVSQKSGNDFFLDATRASVRVIEAGGKKYGYMHLWTMASEDQKNALAGAVYGKLKDTDGFILDIRDGFGGRPEGFGDPFFRPEVNLDWEYSPGTGMKQLFGYQRPLVLLINRGSRSAKEVFSFIMKSSKRAILVGEKTGGNVLGTFPSPVGDWAYLEIPMVDVKANGVRLEKNGVAPDIEVPSEFDRDGKDLYIEEALKVLANAKRKEQR